MTETLVSIAMKEGVKDTVKHLMAALTEGGVNDCLQLLLEMDRMIKSGEFDTTLEKMKGGGR